jgi:hypothetical protein
MNRIKPIYFTLSTWTQSRLMNSSEPKKEEHENCSICLNSTKKMSKWTRLSKGLSSVEIEPENITLSCHHTFHTQCIMKWLHKHNTCPNCRKEI